MLRHDRFDSRALLLGNLVLLQRSITVCSHPDLWRSSNFYQQNVSIEVQQPFDLLFYCLNLIDLEYKLVERLYLQQQLSTSF
jgi:hypothetical protein